MANEDLKKAAHDKGIKLWELADEMNIADGTLSKRLRKEFTDAEKQAAFVMIEDIAERKEG